MISPSAHVVLVSGEEISAAEVFEGLVRLAQNDSPFPLMSMRDNTIAVITAAMDALEYAQERKML